MSRRPASIALRAAVGLALAGLAFLFFRRLDPNLLWTRVKAANPYLLALACAGNFLIVWLKSLRLRLLLPTSPPSEHPLPPTPFRLSRMYLASYAADNLLMSQAGLAIRVAMLRRFDVPLISAIALQALEKLIEGSSLLTLIPLSALGNTPRLFIPILSRPLPLILIIACSLLLLTLLARRFAARSSLIAGTLAAARPLSHPPTFLACVFFSLLTWAIEVAMVIATLSSLHLNLSIATACLVVLAVSFAALIPSLPANLGGFEAAAAFALTTTGLNGTDAFGFALVYHAIHTLPVTLAGLPALRLTPRSNPSLPAQ